jgi:hypothetical protein
LPDLTEEEMLSIGKEDWETDSMGQGTINFDGKRAYTLYLFLLPVDLGNVGGNAVFASQDSLWRCLNYVMSGQTIFHTKLVSCKSNDCI